MSKTRVPVKAMSRDLCMYHRVLLGQAQDSLSQMCAADRQLAARASRARRRVYPHGDELPGTFAFSTRIIIRESRVSTFSEIFRTLWAHKLRSFLTMFGIAWGVGSLVAAGRVWEKASAPATSASWRSSARTSCSSSPAVPLWSQGQMNSARQYLLTYQDYLDIRKEAPHVRNATPVLTRDDVRAVSEFASANGQITGVEPQFGQIRYLPIKQGRWLNVEDEAQKRYVIVLGDEMNRNLFSGRPAVGSTILLNGIRFEVIGTRGAGGPRRQQFHQHSRLHSRTGHEHLLPASRARTSRDSISFINYQPRGPPTITCWPRTRCKKIVARNHGFDYHDDNAFEVWDTIQQSQMIGTIFDAMNILPGQRGHRHAGAGRHRRDQHHAGGGHRAYPGDRLAQSLGRHQSQHPVSVLDGRSAPDPAERPDRHGFVAEASWRRWASVQGPQGFDPPRLVPLTAMLAIGSLTLAGVAAGLYPARKAALLQPVEALRQE